MLTLRQINEGEEVVIVKVNGNGAFRKRMLEMGFVKGKVVKVIKAAPLQDPVEYQIMDAFVSLRLSEADLVEVIKDRKDGETSPTLVISESSKGQQYDVYSKKKDVSGKKRIRVALVGNPNSGKTTIFNFATRSREHTGNYGGVTVDSKRALLSEAGYEIEITDLPGTYSMTDYSPEEMYVRQHIIEQKPDIVINVLDASNLERNLYLTTQLLDLKVKTVVALNMYDDLLLRGDKLDYKNLGKLLGIPFVPTIGNRGKGVRELFRKVIDVYENKDPFVRTVEISYGEEITKSAKNILSTIDGRMGPEMDNFKWYLAIKLLENDPWAKGYLKLQHLRKEVRFTADKEIKRLNSLHTEDTETLIANARYGFIEGALKETMIHSREKRDSLSQKIDYWLTGKYFSYPIFILFVWMMFEVTFIVGEYPVLGIEWLVAKAGQGTQALLPEGIVKDLLVDGVIGGVGAVIVFLPNILILFFFISLLEDTGYMARVAFILDKLMHRIGLHGKSFIPLLMGFGCNVPAIMATRTIENRNDRLVTMLIIPFMSCSARYPVYILLISAFYDKYRGALLFSLYFIGIILAGIVAFILKKTLFKKDSYPFVMELPPYRVPTAKAILRHTWFKGYQYLKKMGGIILIASMIVWALGYFPRSSEIENTYNQKITELQASGALGSSQIENRIKELNAEKQAMQQEQSFVARIGKFIEPVIKPLGFDWKIGVCLIAGSAAKEIVISTMGVLYQASPDEGGTQVLTERLKEQHYIDVETGEKLPVYTPVVILSFLIFVLIYSPCVSVIAAIKKESGHWKWAAFTAIYTTVIAWLASFAIFQIGSLFFS